MGHIVESESKAQMGLGITVPYISPPRFVLDFGDESRNPRDNSYSGSVMGGYQTTQKSINALSKGASYLAVWFCYHIYLTVCEPRWRACQLP